MIYARRFCLAMWSVFFLCQWSAPGFAGNDPSELSGEQQIKAKKLYEEAYVIKEHNPKKALENLKKVVQILPPGHVYRIKAKRLWPKISSDEYPGGDEKPPVSETKPAKSRAKVSPLPKNPAVAQLIKNGNELVKAGKPREAMVRFEKAIELEPGNCDALVGLGVSFARKGKGESAAKWYRAFLKACPDDKRAGYARQTLRAFEAAKKAGRRGGKP
jgi:tetratricopeptide (TPR) repeat protein